MVIRLWLTEWLLEEVTRSSSKHYCFFESMAPFVHCLKYFYKCSTALKKVFSDMFHILDQSFCVFFGLVQIQSFCMRGVWLHSQHLFWFSPRPPRWFSSSVLCVLLQHHWNKICLFAACLEFPLSGVDRADLHPTPPPSWPCLICIWLKYLWRVIFNRNLKLFLRLSAYVCVFILRR